MPRGTGIVAVTSGGPADRARLRPGDVIQSIGPDRSPDAAAMAQALAAARPGDRVTVTITRGTQNLTVPVTLGELPGSWPPAAAQVFVSISTPASRPPGSLGDVMRDPDLGGVVSAVTGAYLAPPRCLVRHEPQLTGPPGQAARRW